jgi:hypothetical protein
MVYVSRNSYVVRVNQRPLRKREGSRATLFAQLEQAVLKPLPATRYQFGEWETARVNIDYHIEVERLLSVSSNRTWRRRRSSGRRSKSLLGW